jgi:hypothetical protein
MMTMSTRTDEIEVWLGEGHGLTDDQIEQLRAIADDITARYCTPDPDVEDPEEARADLLAATAEERDAALTAAYEVLTGDTGVVDEYAARLARARREQSLATAALSQIARMTIEPGDRGRKRPESEKGFAERAGVTRMTVRNWLGRR